MYAVYVFTSIANRNSICNGQHIRSMDFKPALIVVVDFGVVVQGHTLRTTVPILLTAFATIIHPGQHF